MMVPHVFYIDKKGTLLSSRHLFEFSYYSLFKIMHRIFRLTEMCIFQTMKASVKLQNKIVSSYLWGGGADYKKLNWQRNDIK